jgi:hypothetical protein
LREAREKAAAADREKLAKAKGEAAAKVRAHECAENPCQPSSF